MNGVTFGNIHSFDDLGVILSSVKISPATPKTTYVDIPGADGSLDLTEALGEVKYKDRVITFTFTTLPEDDISEKQMEISNVLNGVHFNKITLDKDDDYYWTGRCSVSAYADSYPISKITVKATVNPWKRKQSATTVSSSFGTSYRSIVLSNSRKTVVPNITVTASAKVKFNNVEYAVPMGTQRVLGIALVEGNNTVQVKTAGDTGGTITFNYQEGVL